jgi:tRNA nucleotidyltransferase/poly(A) polymerase
MCPCLENRITHGIAEMPLIGVLLDLTERIGVRSYLVGGAVRDILLGAQTHDLDYAVDGDGIYVARAAADALRGAFVALDERRRTGRVVLTNQQRGPGAYSAVHIDFSSLRGETLDADLRDRDFTINAMAIVRRADGAWRLVDPLQGRADLCSRVLRAASDRAFQSDPVRTLRAVRQSAQLGYAIEPGTRAQLVEAVPELARVSAERIRDEWFRILDQQHAAQALAELRALGLLFALAPPLAQLEQTPCAQGPPLDHAIAAVGATDELWKRFQEGAGADTIPLPDGFDDLLPQIRARYGAAICDERTRIALLRCAALLHNVGDSAAHGSAGSHTGEDDLHDERGSAIADRLAGDWRCSNAEREMLRAVVHGHAAPTRLAQAAPVNRRAIYRYYRRLGAHGLDAAFLALADYAATWGADASSEGWRRQASTVLQLWRAYLVERSKVVDPPPLISGRDLIALGMRPGRRLGSLLEVIREAQGAGEVTDRVEALALARRWIKEHIE